MSKAQNAHMQDDELLAAEYALGTLAAAERLSFEQRLSADPVLQAMVDEWQNNFSPLQEEYAPVAPPAHVFKAIERRLYTSTASRESWWNSLALWRSLALASLAAVVAIGLYTASPQFGSSSPSASFVAELADSTKDLRVVALYNATTGELRLSRAVGAPQQNRDFELWLIPQNEAAISLGVLPQDASFAINLPKELQSKFDQNTLLAISDEPTGGSPTGQATGAVLAIGQLSKI